MAAEELLVLTFSRKAAGEFKQRLLRHVPGAEAATVCTFHSWCGGITQHVFLSYSCYFDCSMHNQNGHAATCSAQELDGGTEALA